MGSAALRTRSPSLEQTTAKPHAVVGNQAMQHLLRTGSIQTKLAVNTPGDQFEQEADRVADQVMRMTSGSAGEAPPSIQRACTSCAKEMEEPPIQRMCKECDEDLS